MEGLKGRLFQVLQTPPAESSFIIKPVGSSSSLHCMDLADRLAFMSHLAIIIPSSFFHFSQ